MSVGVVAIGRNEGDRLKQCLEAAGRKAPHVVYVDSGSHDGSVALARRLGAAVVELDPALPFTAARARNAGFARLRQLCPGLEFVQFVDGDCELDAAWMDAALAHMRMHPSAAVACGRRRERFPEASIYNRLCEVEWDVPTGLVGSCGGDALLRVSAFEEVGGYAAGLIAGEEPDLCRRLRVLGWEIWRLDAEMTAWCISTPRNSATTAISPRTAAAMRSAASTATRSRRSSTSATRTAAATTPIARRPPTRRRCSIYERRTARWSC